jgi:hypothetical protein
MLVRGLFMMLLSFLAMVGLLVLPSSSPLKGSLQYDEKIACCLLTIAQFGKYYVADHRALFLREDSAGRREPSRGGRY